MIINQTYHSYTGKTFGGKTFAVGIEMTIHRKSFALAASCNNECLWLVNYLL